MRKKIFTSIRINAGTEEVWKILTDFEKYPQWNPFIKSLTGEVKEGKQITVKLKGMTFKPIVKTFINYREFKWLGHLWCKGIFDGEHRFYLKENRDGTCILEQSETFSGLLVHLFSKKIEQNTKQGFEAMNKAIKLQTETLAINSSYHL